MNSGEPPQQPPATTRLLDEREKSPSNKRYITLLAINYLALFTGSLSSTLLAKFYFIHGGSSRWVSTWVQSTGFPALLIPILIPHVTHVTHRKPFTNMTKKLLSLSAVVGLFMGLNNLLFSWGTSYLPVSTSSLVLSTQLGFTLVLSWLIVKQRITFNNLNCVVLLTMGSVLLAISSSHDRPKGVTNANYFVGFLCTIGAGFLFALYLPVMEKIYREVYCYEMVIEMQLIMEMAATALATVGMAADGGFTEMRRESENFDIGSNMYWLTIWGSVLSWQLCFMGTAGMVFLTTSLTGGVCMTALLAINVVSGVVVYGDNFGGAKVVSTVLCAWGFCSYVYGLYVRAGREKIMKDVESHDDVGRPKDGDDDRAVEMSQIVT